MDGPENLFDTIKASENETLLEMAAVRFPAPSASSYEDEIFDDEMLRKPEKGSALVEKGAAHRSDPGDDVCDTLSYVLNHYTACCPEGMTGGDAAKVQNCEQAKA